MPYASNDTVRIYYEVIGDGHPVVLQHGLTVNLEVWKWMGFIEPLSEKYQLILIDARGHGKSDKPHTPESYAMKHMVGDIVSVLDDLKINKATFWGYSMGGRIGLAIGKYAPDRFNALIIGGNGLSERDSEVEVEDSKKAIEGYKRYKELVEKYQEEGRSEDIPEWRRRTLPSTDFDAMIAYRSYFENIGMADYLPKLSIPCMIYAGENDTYTHSLAKKCAEIMKNAEFISLEGLSHAEAHFDSEKVVPIVDKFLENNLNR